MESRPVPILEPLSSGALLDEAAHTYQAVGGPILRLSALPLALAYGVITFFGVFVAPGAFLTSNPDDPGAQAIEVASVVAIGLFVAAPLFLSCLGYVSGLVSRLVADLRLGNRPDEYEAQAAARLCLRAMVGANLRSLGIGLSATLASLALLVASGSIGSQDGLWQMAAAVIGSLGLAVGPIAAAVVASMHCLAPTIVVVEDRKPREALRRSIELLKGRGRQPGGYGAVLGVWGLVALIWIAVAVGVGAVFAAFDLSGHIHNLFGAGLPAQVLDRMLRMLPGFLALWTSVPLWCACSTLLYFDRRVRLEGLDIEVLAREVVRRSRESRFQL